ncbi:MAG: helix-turn-helix domain-containing protein [Treponema sp.]|nr:helix-turn-helix domain-containing protein [Treponema sp.]
MESLGEKLKSTRLEKGLSFDQISRETNISIRYLEALETENFSIFPGEPYVIGFLRNYGAYLDLDVQKVISLYRALRIQEQPIPVEQLLKSPPKLPGFVIPLIVILLVIGAVSWGIYSLVVNKKNNPAQNTSENRSPSEYIMEGNSLDRRFYRNDSVLIPLDGETYKLELYNLGETVTIRTPGGSRNLDLGQDVTIDLNSDGIPDLRITVADFLKNNPEMGAHLHFILIDTAAYTGAEIDQAVVITTSAAVSAASSTTIIPSSPSAYPFTLQVSFQGYCMFRWEILNERDRRGTNQRYFQRAEQLDIQAQNGIRIWTSNANAARFQIIGGGRTFPVELGSPGEVVVADFRWVRDDENRYRLILMRLETGN